MKQTRFKKVISIVPKQLKLYSNMTPEKTQHDPKIIQISLRIHFGSSFCYFNNQLQSRFSL